MSMLRTLSSCQIKPLLLKVKNKHKRLNWNYSKVINGGQIENLKEKVNRKNNMTPKTE